MLLLHVISIVSVAVAIATSSHHRCPAGYTLQWEGHCVKIIGLNVQSTRGEAAENGLAECAKDGAYLPIIRNKQEDDVLASVFFKGAGNYYIYLGATCNETTNKFEWADGTRLDYVNGLDANTPCKGLVLVQDLRPGSTWGAYSASNSDDSTLICVKRFENRGNEPCSDFEAYPTAPAPSACFQASSGSIDWATASKLCSAEFSTLAAIHDTEENRFIRELAASNGHLAGAHLGATVTGKGANDFGWIDGSDMDYTNFANGFPITGIGSCVAMNTNEVAGDWVNTECSTKLPFVCRRDPNLITPACGSRIYQPGEIITPPGFPRSASEPCDYYLKVDAGKILELEILALEANACCDRLVLYNGQIGDDLIANLTGSDQTGDRFRTTSDTNVMRVSWQPKGAVNVRGFMLTFRAV